MQTTACFGQQHVSVSSPSYLAFRAYFIRGSKIIQIRSTVRDYPIHISFCISSGRSLTQYANHARESFPNGRKQRPISAYIFSKPLHLPHLTREEDATNRKTCADLVCAYSQQDIFSNPFLTLLSLTKEESKHLLDGLCYKRDSKGCAYI